MPGLFFMYRIIVRLSIKEIGQCGDLGQTDLSGSVRAVLVSTQSKGKFYGY